MNASPAGDAAANLAELQRLAAAGCELSRLAVPRAETLPAFAQIVSASPLPLVADIHFDAHLALGALEAGASALRINPGNIHQPELLREVARQARQRGVPIRIGVNAGSVDRHLLDEEGGLTARALLRSAQEAIQLMESVDFTDLCISIKASSAPLMIEANRLLAKACPYPLHLGLTEAGPAPRGAIRSAAALAPLLEAGIGDTIRVSLTGDPVQEVQAAWQILEALDLRVRGPRLIACPGCGRTEVDLEPLARRVEAYLDTIHVPLQVAVMGCAVNGPGEAREADLGVAGGKHEWLLFRKGKIVRKLAESEVFAALCAAIDEAADAARAVGSATAASC